MRQAVITRTDSWDLIAIWLIESWLMRILLMTCFRCAKRCKTEFYTFMKSMSSLKKVQIYCSTISSWTSCADTLISFPLHAFTPYLICTNTEPVKSRIPFTFRTNSGINPRPALQCNSCLSTLSSSTTGHQANNLLKLRNDELLQYLSILFFTLENLQSFFILWSFITAIMPFRSR